MYFGLSLYFRHNGGCGFLRQVFCQGAGDHHFGLASAMLALADLFESLPGYGSLPSHQEGRGLNARPRRQIDWMKGYLAALAYWASSEAFGPLHFNSEALEDVYAAIRQGRSDQGSLPCSTPLQSRARTSSGSPHIRRLPLEP